MDPFFPRTIAKMQPATTVTKLETVTHPKCISTIKQCSQLSVVEDQENLEMGDGRRGGFYSQRSIWTHALSLTWNQHIYQAGAPPRSLSLSLCVTYLHSMRGSVCVLGVWVCVVGREATTCPVMQHRTLCSGNMR